MQIKENIRLAFRTINGNKLRSGLTLTIIALGISALIGILTATDGITKQLLTSFSEMGANTFSIKNDATIRKGGGKRMPKKNNPVLTYDQMVYFKKKYSYPSIVSFSSLVDNSAVVRYENKKTNPNVKLFGVDENYLAVSGYGIEAGRFFTNSETDEGQNVVILGKDVVAKLFDKPDNVINKMIAIGNVKYRVIGVLASKGQSQVSTDNQLMIPVLNAKRTYGDDKTSYIVNVMVKNATQLDAAIDEATGVMRIARKLPLEKEEDFDIVKSDKLASEVISNLSTVRIATLIIGILTMIGAGVGLMNIMLVSVNERTREIGTVKALGATKQNILIQFLTESLTMCTIGGLIGIVIGILLGNLVGLALNTGFIMPWYWIGLGLVFTFGVGLLSGIYPAYKASSLDPVEALRYE